MTEATLTTDSSADYLDPQRPVAFSANKMSRRYLEAGIVCLVLGIGIAIFIPPRTYASYDGLMTAGSILLGLVLTIYATHRLMTKGKPLLLLSPAGLRQHIEWVKDIDIPWREVRGVETTDITGSFRGHTVFLPGVTVVLVSRAFYDRHIHIGSWLLRGPGWDTNYIPKGDMVQVALHHEALPVTAKDLRAAVELRWQTFRDASPANMSVPLISRRI